MQAERKGGKGKTPAAAGGRLPTALAWLLPALLNAASVLRFGSKNAAFVSSPSRAEPVAAEFCLFIFAFVKGGRWPRRAAGGPAGLGDSSGGPSLCPPEAPRQLPRLLEEPGALRILPVAYGARLWGGGDEHQQDRRCFGICSFVLSIFFFYLSQVKRLPAGDEVQLLQGVLAPV